MLFQHCRAVRIRAAPCFCLIARGGNRRTLHFIINEPSHASLSKRRVFCAISAGLRTFSGLYAQIRQFLLAHFWAGVMCRSVRLFSSRRYDASCRCPAHSFRIGLHFGGAPHLPGFLAHFGGVGAAKPDFFAGVPLLRTQFAPLYPARCKTFKLNRALRTVDGLPRPIISACPAHVSPPSPRRFAMRKSADFLGRFLPCAK